MPYRRTAAENVAEIENLAFSTEELAEIETHATDSDINVWGTSSEHGKKLSSL
jgi:hypothetical protein